MIQSSSSYHKNVNYLKYSDSRKVNFSFVAT